MEDEMSKTSFDAFVREIPDRSMRRVIEARDEIEAEANVCARTQSWSPKSIRSSWVSELRDVVSAIDALREAHEQVEDADDADREDLVEYRAEAFGALEEAVEAADDEAKRLAQRVAELEAESAIEAIERKAYDASDDEEWTSELADLAKRGQDGDRGWSLEVLDDGSIKVTGWAQTRVVQDDGGSIVLGSDWSDLEEHVVTGRVVFLVEHVPFGSSEPSSSHVTFAEAEAAIESLAQVHGIEDGWEAWSIVARWVPNAE